MKQEWRSIEGFEGLYEVSNYGEVKALERIVENNGGMQRKHERILKQNTKSHCVVVLCKNGKTYSRLVHRLVAIAFIPNPENKPVVDHIDTNPMNNRADNLRWVTIQENCMNPLTRMHNSESKKGHAYYGRPLTEDEKDKIRKANTGRKFTEEHKKKLSEAHKSSNVAKEQSVINLQKAQESNRGKQRSEKTKELIREKMIGVHKGKRWKIEKGKRVWY